MCGADAPLIDNGHFYYGFLVIEKTEIGHGFVFKSPRGILPVKPPIKPTEAHRLENFRLKLIEAELRAGIGQPIVRPIRSHGKDVLNTIRRLNAEYGFPGFGGWRRAA